MGFFQTDIGRQANEHTENDKSADLNLFTSGVGFLPHRRTQADMQTNAQNDTSTDLKLPTSGFGFLPHRQTDRQANTTTQNDKSTSLKLPASGVIIIIDRFYIVLFSALEQTH